MSEATEFWGLKAPTRSGWWSLPHPQNEGEEAVIIFDDQEKALSFAEIMSDGNPHTRSFLASKIKKIKRRDLSNSTTVALNPVRMPGGMGAQTITWQDAQDLPQEKPWTTIGTMDPFTGKEVEPPELKEEEFLILMGIGDDGTPWPIVHTDPEDGDRGMLIYSSYENLRRALSFLHRGLSVGTMGTADGGAIASAVVTMEDVAELAQAYNEDTEGEIDGVAIDKFSGKGDEEAYAFMRLQLPGKDKAERLRPVVEPPSEEALEALEEQLSAKIGKRIQKTVRVYAGTFDEESGLFTPLEGDELFQHVPIPRVGTTSLPGAPFPPPGGGDGWTFMQIFHNEPEDRFFLVFTVWNEKPDIPEGGLDLPIGKLPPEGTAPLKWADESKEDLMWDEECETPAPLVCLVFPNKHTTPDADEDRGFSREELKRDMPGVYESIIKAGL